VPASQRQITYSRRYPVITVRYLDPGRGVHTFGIWGGGSNPTIENKKIRFSVTQIWSLNSFYRAMLYASAVLAMGSVCLSQVGVLLKRLNVGSHTQHHTRDSSFLKPKISAKFDRSHPLRGAKCRWGGSKSATFDK